MSIVSIMMFDIIEKVQIRARYVYPKGSGGVMTHDRPFFPRVSIFHYVMQKIRFSALI